MAVAGGRTSTRSSKRTRIDEPIADSDNEENKQQQRPEEIENDENQPPVNNNHNKKTGKRKGVNSITTKTTTTQLPDQTTAKDNNISTPEKIPNENPIYKIFQNAQSLTPLDSARKLSQLFKKKIIAKFNSEFAKDTLGPINPLLNDFENDKEDIDEKIEIFIDENEDFYQNWIICLKIWLSSPSTPQYRSTFEKIYKMLDRFFTISQKDEINNFSNNNNNIFNSKKRRSKKE